MSHPCCTSHLRSQHLIRFTVVKLPGSKFIGEPMGHVRLLSILNRLTANRDSAFMSAVEFRTRIHLLGGTRAHNSACDFEEDQIGSERYSGASCPRLSDVSKSSNVTSK